MSSIAKTKKTEPKLASRATVGKHIEYRESLGKTLKEMTADERKQYNRLQASAYRRRNGSKEYNKSRDWSQYGVWAVQIRHDLKDRVLNAEAALPDFDVTNIVETAFTLYMNALERQHNDGEPFPQRETK